jgi:hypothetical protein
LPCRLQISRLAQSFASQDRWIILQFYFAVSSRSGRCDQVTADDPKKGLTCIDWERPRGCCPLRVQTKQHVTQREPSDWEGKSSCANVEQATMHELMFLTKRPRTAKVEASMRDIAERLKLPSKADHLLVSCRDRDPGTATSFRKIPDAICHSYDGRNYITYTSH